MSRLAWQSSESVAIVRDQVQASAAVVLNALMTSASGGKRRILVAVRRPATNIRHPGVVSMPTMRIPAGLAPLLAPGQPAAHEERWHFHSVEGPSATFGMPGAGRGMTSFLTETLLSRKLGASDLLETGRLTGRCAVRMLSEGVVDDPTGTTEDEHTQMHTIVVQVSEGAHLLPRKSAAYSDIRWVDADLLRRAWQRRDAQMLVPDGNPFEICIRGLCIRSGVELLDTAKNIFASDDATYGEREDG